MESVLCVISILQLYCNLSAWIEPIEIAWEWRDCLLSPLPGTCWHLGSKYSVSAEKSWELFVHLSILWRNLDSFTGHSGVQISFIVQRNIYAGDEHLVSFSVQLSRTCHYTGQSEDRIVTQCPGTSNHFRGESSVARHPRLSVTMSKCILYGQYY